MHDENHCNDQLRPIIMVHGFLASGDTYAKQFQRFASNEYCTNRLFVLDWNTLSGSNSDQLLDNLIDSVRTLTQTTQIDLIGHSAGSGLAFSYLNDSLHATKVAHYIHLAGQTPIGAAGPNGEIPTLQIYSDADAITNGGADAPECTNVHQTTNDHYQVATSASSFKEIYKFVRNGIEPDRTVVVPQSGKIAISGKALTLGENIPAAAATIQIFELNKTNGSRLRTTPDTTLTTQSNGTWGTFSAKSETPYEFYINTGQIGDRPIHYYRQGFTREDRLVYLRTLPAPGSLAGILLANLPKDDNQSVIAVFTENQAVITGRDSLHVNELSLSTPTISSAANSNIAFFLYDGNNNAQTDGTNIGLFTAFPFLEGVDQYFQTATPQAIEVTFNGKTQWVQNWKSASEGISVVVFE
jgi:hypothetical protein